jgi:hypothetical protein
VLPRHGISERQPMVAAGHTPHSATHACLGRGHARGAVRYASLRCAGARDRDIPVRCCFLWCPCRTHDAASTLRRSSSSCGSSARGSVLRRGPRSAEGPYGPHCQVPLPASSAAIGSWRKRRRDARNSGSSAMSRTRRQPNPLIGNRSGKR